MAITSSFFIAGLKFFFLLLLLLFFLHQLRDKSPKQSHQPNQGNEVSQSNRI